MKNLYVIILFICTAQVSNAQSNSSRSTVWLLDSVKTWQFDIISKAFDKPLFAQYYTYDGSNNEIVFLEEAYSSGAWSNSYQDSFYYNNQNEKTSQVYQTWSGSTLSNSTLTDYDYNVQGEQDSSTGYDWAGSWVLSGGSSSTFDVNKNLISTLGWTYDNPTWLYSTLDSFTYNGNNEKTSELQLTWGGSAWDNNNLYTYTYDGNGNDTGELVQTWNVNSWSNVASFSNTFDGNNNLSYSIRLSLNGATANDSSQYYYHSATSAGVTDVANVAPAIYIYPNPASTFANISFTNTAALPLTITLFDITGRELLEQPVTANPERLDVRNFAAGVYEVLMTDNEGNRTVKQVVIK